MKIQLRKLSANDIDHFMKWASDPEVTKSLLWDHYTSKDAALQFLKDVAEKHPWFMAICLEGKPVGSMTLDVRAGSGKCRAELGYVLAKKYWGQGIATKAISLMLEIGFRDLGVQRIEAFVDPDNIGSVRVLEKSGFTKEGLLQKYMIHRGQVRNRLIFAKIRE
jgi:RimJ/RimL family protein N-acetyltransferase